MIDIHNHILPGIDDGAKSLGECIEMIKLAREEGITKLVVTPHFYRGLYENNYEDVLELLQSVKEEKIKQNIDIEIFPGQEIFLDNYTIESYKAGTIKGINDTKYMLIELSMDRQPKDVLNVLYELRLLGIVPIIAHPERYAYVIEKPHLINEFIEENCLFQVNSGSILGRFGKEVQKTTEILINHRIVDFIASDSHTTKGRSPNLIKPLDMAENKSKGIKIKVMSNAEKLLENKDIKQEAEKIKEIKSIFWFLKK